MDQRRSASNVNRRRFLKTAGGAGAALTAWSLGRPAPARAAIRTDRARAAEPNPKRGGVLKWAGPSEVPHFDVHQGSPRVVLCQMHNNLVRFNPADGLKTIIPDLAESWKVSSDGDLPSLRDGVKFPTAPRSLGRRGGDVLAHHLPPAGMATLQGPVRGGGEGGGGRQAERRSPQRAAASGR
jgi:hypothetical protein